MNFDPRDAMTIMLDDVLPEYPSFDPAYRRAPRREAHLTQADKELAIRNAYLQIGQLETAYVSAQADLTKAQADYRAVQINYQAGNVTKTTVEQAEMGVLKAENALKELAYNHEMLLFTFAHPFLLSASSGSQSGASAQ